MDLKFSISKQQTWVKHPVSTLVMLCFFTFMSHIVIKISPSFRQFHQHFTSAFFVQNFGPQKMSNPKHSFVIFGAKISHKKCKRKTLMKLTPCVTSLTIVPLTIIQNFLELRLSNKIEFVFDLSTNSQGKKTKCVFSFFSLFFWWTFSVRMWPEWWSSLLLDAKKLFVCLFVSHLLEF